MKYLIVIFNSFQNTLIMLSGKKDDAMSHKLPVVNILTLVKRF